MVEPGVGLCFLVNPRSGGGQGAALAAVLRRFCGAESVFILGEQPLSQLLAAKASSTTRWVACGGDGTVSALASVVQDAGISAPIGVIPLGTGNDFARSLGWASMNWNDSTISALVGQLAAAKVCLHDGWRLLGPGVNHFFMNYCSIGGDAEVAQQFHETRQRHPNLLRGALVNKGMYALLGALQRAFLLRQHIRFIDDLVLPEWAHALVFVNISSYASGVTLVPDGRRDDGVLEAVALGHGLAFGLVTAQLRRPRLLKRLAAITFSVGAAVPMQVDGEPFIAEPGVYHLQHAGQVNVLVAHGTP